MLYRSEPDRKTRPPDFHIKRDTTGESFVLIWRPDKFIERVSEKAKAVASKLMLGTVEYVSPDEHAGEMGPFRKHEHYAHQREFRLALNAAPPTDKPITFDLGPLDDIAVIGDTAAFTPIPVSV